MNGAERPVRTAEYVPRNWHARFRPYVWRDPARVTPQQAAELAGWQRADWGGCDRCFQHWDQCRCPA